MTAMAPNHVPSAGREAGQRRGPRRKGAGRGAAGEWVAFLPRFVARTLLMTVAAMLFWAVLPALFGWHATTVMSDSMAPRLLRGDVVVSLPIDGARVAVGQVALFDDPDHPGRLRMHRVIKVGSDHTLTTKGDANPSADSTPVKASAVHGVGVLRVPLIAYPIVWLHERDLAKLGVAGAGLAVTVALAFPAEPRRRRRHRSSRPHSGLPTAAITFAAAVAVAGLAAGAIATPAHAAFSSTSGTGTSSFAAAAAFQTASPTTVTAAQLGISPATPGTSIVDASIPVDSAGTIASPYNPCVTVHITSTSGSQKWEVKVNSTQAPYNSAPVSAWNLQLNGATTGRIVSGPDANGYVYITGAESVSLLYPFGSTDWLTKQAVNTPVAPGQVATLYFCISIGASNTAPVLPAVDAASGATNYTVSAPTLVGAGGGAPTADYACAAVTVTGYYPHFWIGYKFSLDWTALIQAAQTSGQISPTIATALAAKTLGSQWAQSSGPSATAVKESAPSTPGHAVYDVTSTGISGNGAITNGVSVTLHGCTS